MPTSPNTPPQPNRRLYVSEGGVHLYSSLPTVMRPSDLYTIKENPHLKGVVEHCNIYLITARARIFVDPSLFTFEGGVMGGSFIVAREHGPERVGFGWTVLGNPFGDGTPVHDVAVAQNGTQVALIDASGRGTMVPVLRLVAEARSALTDADRDLEVLYVGQGIGRSKQRTALDRLLNHSTLQRILADAVTLMPNMEILLLLYRFEHHKKIMSTGGDLMAEPIATPDEELAHMRRMSDATIPRPGRIALAEAALIRYFQPHYNVQIKQSDFAARQKLGILKQVLKADLTGVLVEICSANIRSRLQTTSAPPRDMREIFSPEMLAGGALEDPEHKKEWQEQLQQMAHSHFANFALTTPQERDTFMHGTLWHGSDKRSGPFAM